MHNYYPVIQHGKTALMIAQELSHQEMIEMLEADEPSRERELQVYIRICIEVEVIDTSN